MKSEIIRFPGDIKVDIFNVSDDFEEQIKKAFGKYTRGTAKDYTYQDKLCFIDHMVEKLHKAGDEWDAVKNLLMERFEYELDECGDLPDRGDFESVSFMQDCYVRGREDGRLYYQFEDKNGIKDHHIYDRIMQLEYRAIKAVMDWEGEELTITKDAGTKEAGEGKD